MCREGEGVPWLWLGDDHARFSEVARWPCNLACLAFRSGFWMLCLLVLLSLRALGCAGGVRVWKCLPSADLARAEQGPSVAPTRHVQRSADIVHEIPGTTRTTASQ